MDIMHRNITLFRTLALAALSLLVSFHAHAFHYGFDGTFGVSYASKAGGYMVGTQEPPLGSSSGFPFGLSGVIGIGNPQATFSFFLGAAYRFAAYSKGSYSYNMQALYPLARINIFKQIYIQGGATPLVYKRVMKDFGIGGFSRGGSPMALYAEVGYEVPISPEIAFIPAVAVTQVSGAGAPTPRFFDALIGFRLFYGDWKGSSSGGKKYDGYRYPFGREKPR